MRDLEHHVGRGERVGVERLGARHQRDQRAAGGVRQRAREGEQAVVDRRDRCRRGRRPSAHQSSLFAQHRDDLRGDLLRRRPRASSRRPAAPAARARRAVDAAAGASTLTSSVSALASVIAWRRRAIETYRGGELADCTPTTAGSWRPSTASRPAGVLLHDARGPVATRDADDDAGLRPAQRGGEVAAPSGRTRRRASARRSGRGRGPAARNASANASAAVRESYGSISPASTRTTRSAPRAYATRSACSIPSACSPTAVTRGAGGLLDQHGLFERLVVEVVDRPSRRSSRSMSVPLVVELELVARLRHQP